MFCHKCNESIPDISRYCLHCGVFLDPQATETAKNPDCTEIVDWEKRVLCGDGTCTGTIEEGKCTVCGMPGPGGQC